MSTIVDIADALVAELNTATFSRTIAAERHYVPVVELADDALHVMVVPKTEDITNASRTQQFWDDSIDIGILQKLDASDQANTIIAQADALMNLVEEIAKFTTNLKLAAMPTAGWVATRHDPVFAPDHFEQYGQFTSVLTVTYRVRQ